MFVWSDDDINVEKLNPLSPNVKYTPYDVTCSGSSTSYRKNL